MTPQIKHMVFDLRCPPYDVHIQRLHPHLGGINCAYTFSCYILTISYELRMFVGSVVP